MATAAIWTPTQEAEAFAEFLERLHGRITKNSVAKDISAGVLEFTGGREYKDLDAVVPFAHKDEAYEELMVSSSRLSLSTVLTVLGGHHFFATRH